MKRLLFSVLAIIGYVSCCFAQSMIIYGTNGSKTVYKLSSIDRVEFSESDPVGVPEPVDLGLSMKWANMNIGADMPEDFGWLVAWGETEPKDVYIWDSYKWEDHSSHAITKYCTLSNYGSVDSKLVLESGDDAARLNWGSGWRMPTKLEMEELCNNCTWEWVTYHGVNGHKVTGPNGNHIFLPAAGFYESSRFAAGREGYYWTSSVDKTSPDKAYCLTCSSNRHGLTSVDRNVGAVIRAVCY